MFMPTQILWLWLRGLLSIALIAGGIWLLAEWYQRRERIVEEPAPAFAVGENRDARPRIRVERWLFGWSSNG